MAQLDRLIRDARKAMKARNHVPMPANRSESGGTAIIKCERCKEEVIVTCKPKPNEIHIAGGPVAFYCNVATKSNLIADAAEAVETIGEDELERHSIYAVFGC